MTTERQRDIRVKICCIKNLSEAELAIAYGASCLGLVGHMPSGPGIISDEQIKDIASSVPEHIATFLLTSETSVHGIIAHHQRTRTTTIQIVDDLTHGTHDELKVALPDIEIVQVIHVIDESSILKAQHISKSVDALLLDSGNPNLQIKKLGGTGKTHDWALSKKIVDAVSIPVFLAGGLNSNNILEAAHMVGPNGFDLCSGLRTNGQLDEEKLANFMNKIRTCYEA